MCLCVVYMCVQCMCVHVCVWSICVYGCVCMYVCGLYMYVCTFVHVHARVCVCVRDYAWLVYHSGLLVEGSRSTNDGSSLSSIGSSHHT